MPINYEERYRDLVNVINNAISLYKSQIIKDANGAQCIVNMETNAQIRALNMVLDIHKKGEGINY